MADATVDIKRGSNIMDTIGYWKDYPERDLEHVRRYPCVVQLLDEHELWESPKMALTCQTIRTGSELSKQLDLIEKETVLYKKQPYVLDKEITNGYLDINGILSLDSDRIQGFLNTIINNFTISKNLSVLLKTDFQINSEDKYQTLYRNKVNRLSFCLESKDSCLYNFTGDSVSIDELAAEVVKVRNSGIQDLSVDIKLNQDFAADIEVELIKKIFINANVAAVSINSGNQGILPVDINAEYAKLVTQLIQNGYVLNAINCFIKDKNDINTTYDEVTHSTFNNHDILALGPGNTGNLKGYSYRNAQTESDYSALCQENRLPVVQGKELKADEKLKISIISGIIQGRINKNDFKLVHGMDITVVIPDLLEWFKSNEYVTIDDKNICLTIPEGLENLNQIIEKILI